MKRLSLAHLPTPLERPGRLCDALGIDLWIKRDDATLGAEAGNKIRKLEFLLADALEKGADTVITCGGMQSNHARATALLAARLGLSAVLFLRVADLSPEDDGMLAKDPPLVGNVFLDWLAGAEIRLITPASYQRRMEIMQRHAAGLSHGYVIPEGGSNGIGAFGYIEAMTEIREQLGDAAPFDMLVHACGSGGTLAGCALGARRARVANEVRAMAVCDDAAYFERTAEAIMNECRVLDPSLEEPASWRVDDRFKGPAYAVSTAEQRRVMIEVSRLSGLVLDPVYTGKAFFGLWQMKAELADRRVLFLHTGGLPGLLADAGSFQKS